MKGLEAQKTVNRTEKFLVYDIFPSKSLQLFGCVLIWNDRPRNIKWEGCLGKICTGVIHLPSAAFERVVRVVLTPKLR
jgi:hypothetical protein